MKQMLVEEAAERLKAAGVRMTAQRKIILKHIFQSETHPTAEEIFADICKQHVDFQTLSVGTIYNNLKLLKKYGLIKEIYSHTGTARYDRNLDTHHHLCCMNCGKIVDIHFTITLPIKELHEVLGFSTEDLTIEIRGKCSECKSLPAES